MGIRVFVYFNCFYSKIFDCALLFFVPFRATVLHQAKCLQSTNKQTKRYRAFVGLSTFPTIAFPVVKCSTTWFGCATYRHTQIPAVNRSKEITEQTIVENWNEFVTKNTPRCSFLASIDCVSSPFVDPHINSPLNAFFGGLFELTSFSNNKSFRSILRRDYRRTEWFHTTD